MVGNYLRAIRKIQYLHGEIIQSYCTSFVQHNEYAYCCCRAQILFPPKYVRSIILHVHVEEHDQKCRHRRCCIYQGIPDHMNGNWTRTMSGIGIHLSTARKLNLGLKWVRQSKCGLIRTTGKVLGNCSQTSDRKAGWWWVIIFVQNGKYNTSK